MNLRDLTDAELFVQIGGDWGVGDCFTELACRLAVIPTLTAELEEARANEGQLWERLQHQTAQREAAEADRDRLIEALENIKGEADGQVAAGQVVGWPWVADLARAALAAARKEKG